MSLPRDPAVTAVQMITEYLGVNPGFRQTVGLAEILGSAVDVPTLTRLAVTINDVLQNAHDERTRSDG